MESRYLTSVKSGDIDAVDRILSDNIPLGLNRNAADEYDRTSLMIAIEDGNIEMLKLLLKHEVSFGDSLLHAVNVEFVEGVRILCEAAILEKEFGIDHLNNYPSGKSHFPQSTTPLMLAGERNNPEIIQILLQYGAKMPTLHDVLPRCNDSFNASLARISWFKAITCDSYLVLNYENPIKEAFELCHQINQASSRSPQMKPQYDLMHDKLVSFVTKILDMTRNKSEIRAVLGEKNSIRTTEGSLNSKVIIPERLALALRMNFKKFVAHPTLQESLLSDWYYGWKNWNQLSNTKFALVSLLIMICFPFLSILYIIIPNADFAKFMQTPYIRFLMNTGSRIYLLLILICSTLSTSVFFESSVIPIQNDLLKFLSYKGPPPDLLVVIVYAWIAGIFWLQLKTVWHQGFTAFVRNKWNLVDSVQLLLYCCYVVMNTMALLKALEISSQYLDKPEKSPTTEMYVYPRPTMPQRRPDHVPNTDLMTSAITPSTPELQFGTTVHNKIWDPANPGEGYFSLFQAISASYKGEDRLSWSGWDPLLVAEASFALANVFSFLGLMHNMVFLGFVGPLQISLGGMLVDILKFLLLFSLVWVSFAIGFTQLYRTFEVLEDERCKAEQDLECKDLAFDTFLHSLDTLFWSLFGLIRMDNIRIAPNNPEHQLRLTEFVGFGMYTVYLVLAVTVLLNALIAMMSTTYSMIEQNSITEWMVARTGLMTKYMCQSVGALPPPFNIIPSINDVICLVRKIYVYFDCLKPTHQKDEKHEKGKEKTTKEKYNAIVRTLTARYIRTKQAEEARRKITDSLNEDVNDLKRTVEKMSSCFLIKSIEGQRSGANKSIEEHG